MEIGTKLKNLRLRCGLTQEELADRCELTKGYISQLENDLTMPTISTLNDLMVALGSDLKTFFSEDEPEQVVFTSDDFFEKEGDGQKSYGLCPTVRRTRWSLFISKSSRIRRFRKICRMRAKNSDTSLTAKSKSSSATTSISAKTQQLLFCKQQSTLY